MAIYREHSTQYLNRRTCGFLCSVSLSLHPKSAVFLLVFRAGSPFFFLSMHFDIQQRKRVVGDAKEKEEEAGERRTRDVFLLFVVSSFSSLAPSPPWLAINGLTTRPAFPPPSVSIFSLTSLGSYLVSDQCWGCLCICLHT